ncbi:MAG: methyl-accepting chemotaxis protein [Magnetospirillum sp. WYHS-4]
MGEQDNGCSEELLGILASGDYGKIRDGQVQVPASIRKLAEGLERHDRDTLKGNVQVSIECGEAMISIAEMTRAVAEVNNRAQAIAAAAEEMVASVKDIATTSDAAAHDANGVEVSARQGMQAAEKAVSTMRNIARAVEDAAAKVNSLAEASAQIGEIVDSIEAIAKQTNLLALNATIEAARAGEAGKGFAVVAGEVKNLANQTAKATDDIRNRIERLRTEMATIVKSMEQGAKAVAEGEEVIVATGDGMRAIGNQITGVTSKMQDIASILSQQSEASSEVAQGVSMIADMANHNANEIVHVADAMDKASSVIAERVNAVVQRDILYKVVHVAKADHVTFKKNIMDVVIGRKSLRADDVADHHGCRLGKWYYSVTDSRIKDQSAFRRMEDPHDRVHRYGKEVLRAMAKGDMDKAVADVGKMNSASHEVLELLDELARSLNA